MNAKFFVSVSSLLILLVSAAFAPAQNVLLFTFDDSGPNVTATVTGSFDTSGMLFVRQTTPNPPGMFPFHSSTGFFWGTTTATNVDVFEGATAIAPEGDFAFLFTFFPGGVDTPLSEYLDIHASNHPGFSWISLAEGEASFSADTLENNTIVFQEGALADYGASGFLSTTPITVLSDPGGENTIQFVLAVPEIVLGDVNQDDVVNFSDIPRFIDVLLAGSFLEQADCNQDGEVNFSDIPQFVEILAAD